MNKNLITLFQESNYKSFEEYLNILQMITKINLNNLSVLKAKYNIYIEYFNYIKTLNIKTIRQYNKYCKLSNIGFYSLTNLNVKYWVDRGFSEIEAKEFIKNRQSTNNALSLKDKLNITLEEANNIVQNRAKKGLNTLNNKYSIDELKDINSKKDSNSLNHLLSSINKDTKKNYTIEEVKLIQLNKLKGIRNFAFKDIHRNTKIEFYLNKGFSYNESIKMLSDRQNTFSLEKCIFKYGYDIGIQKWNLRQEKWQNTLNSKSEEEKYKILLKKMKNKKYSNSSIEYFEKLKLSILSNIKYDKINFYYKDDEYFIRDGKKLYFYDFAIFINDIKIIIEYNGSHIHPSKDNMTIEQWNNWTHFFNKKSADDCLLFDEYKKQLALKNNFSYFVIWDYDLKTVQQKHLSIENIIDKIKKLT